MKKRAEIIVRMVERLPQSCIAQTIKGRRGKAYNIAYCLVEGLCKARRAGELDRDKEISSIEKYLEKKFKKARKYTVEEIIENSREIINHTARIAGRKLVEFDISDLDKANTYAATHNCGKVWLNGQKWQMYEYGGEDELL